MTTVRKRLEEVIKELSPEDKARLLVEEPLRSEPVLSTISPKKLLGSMTSREQNRFHTFLGQVDTVTDCVVRPMVILGQTLEKVLLERDRVLWYLRALEDTVQGVTLSPIVRFVTDPERGESIDIRVPFARLHLGQWHRGRLHVGAGHGVELEEDIESLLKMLSQRIGKLVSALKSMYRYVVEESERLNLDFLKGLAVEIVYNVATWDQPTMKNLIKMNNAHQDKRDAERQGDEGGSVSEASLQRGRGIFPVEERWELDWEGIREDEGFSTHLREDPSKCPDIVFTLIHGDGPEDVLEYCKRLAREGIGDSCG